MSGIGNENYLTGGTGAALFGGAASGADARAKATAHQALGDEYVPPVGLPEWKQPSFDDDDHVDPDKFQNAAPQSVWSKLIVVQNELGVAKAFYFCFFGAFGSLFPLMAVFFKGLGMDAAQCGFLIGVRPIIEYLATPFWHGMSDRFQAGKLLLLMTVASWIVFTLPVGFIHPPVVSCKFWNGSTYLLQEPGYMKQKQIEKRSIEEDLFLEDSSMDNRTEEVVVVRVKRDDYTEYKWAPGYVVGTSPQVIRFYDLNKNYEKGMQEWVTPSFSNEVFERSGVEKVFFLLLLLVIIGEFFASPAIALADSAVITSLGDQQDKYGAQRMFGSIGWGITMFIMGIVLDYSTIFPSAKCEMNEGERNYHVCFYMFSLMMLAAWLVATQIQFRYSMVRQHDIPLGNVSQNGGPGGRKAPAKTREEKLKEQAEKMKVFAKQLQSMPEFAAVFKAFSNVRLLMFMLVAWVMGIGIGLIFTFLFWHLQDYGGHPTIFGIASVINHVSEMGAYFYSFKIISQYGHVKVLMAGLLGNVVRFIYISFITWPWLVLPFEFLQGITHAAVWAACCSFISHNTAVELRPSAQGVLQGIHHGFGRFCGAVFGGMLIKDYGTTIIFRVYGLICGVVLVLFFVLNFYNISEGKFTTDLPEELDPRNAEAQQEYLAPHGVPSSGYKPKPLSRRPSNEDLSQTQPPAAAAVNPFLEDSMAAQGQYYGATGAATAESGQYYGRGYSQAQSGYSSSGLGY